MDFSGLLTILVAAFAGSVAGLLGGSIVGGLWLFSRIHALEQRVISLANKQISPLGAQARQEKAERYSAAMAEAMTAMQQEGAKPEEVLKQVAAKYPDVALDVGKKILSGKSGGLSQFIKI